MKEKIFVEGTAKDGILSVSEYNKLWSIHKVKFQNIPIVDLFTSQSQSTKGLMWPVDHAMPKSVLCLFLIVYISSYPLYLTFHINLFVCTLIVWLRALIKSI